jgi:hypothetical protein
VISGSEVKSHVESFSEGAEKAGNEFGSTVRGDMFWYSMLGKDVENKQYGKVFRRTVDSSRNKNALFS